MSAAAVRSSGPPGESPRDRRAGGANRFLGGTGPPLRKSTRASGAAATLWRSLWMLESQSARRRAAGPPRWRREWTSGKSQSSAQKSTRASGAAAPSGRSLLDASSGRGGRELLELGEVAVGALPGLGGEFAGAAGLVGFAEEVERRGAAETGAAAARLARERLGVCRFRRGAVAERQRDVAPALDDRTRIGRRLGVNQRRFLVGG